MASFNQSPLGQASRILPAASMVIGSAANSATVVQNVQKFIHSNSGLGQTIFVAVSPIAPKWRRESKYISAIS